MGNNHRSCHRRRSSRLVSFSVAASCLLCNAHPALALSSKQTLSLPVKVLYDSSNHLHRDRQYHPEQSARIDACLTKLDWYTSSRFPAAAAAADSTILDVIDLAPDSAGKCGNVAARRRHEPVADDELEHARSILVEAHSETYVSNLERRCRSSRQRRIDEGKSPLGFVGYIDGGDTYLTTESYDVSLRGTAAWIRAADIALGRRPLVGTTDDIPGAVLALTRPPGHHATKDLSNGFCIFNYAAAAAIHALRTNPNLRVSIVDWDVHYGQGVADIVQDYDRVRYASIHQLDLFPYEGMTHEVLGKHSNVMTIPVRPGSTWTHGYRDAFVETALPFIFNLGRRGESANVTMEDGWTPDLVIVCAGYDALDSDELASVSLTAEDFGEMTRSLMDRIGWVTGGDSTEKSGRGIRSKLPGLILGLEGGYQLREGAAGGNLADAVLETIKAVMGEL